MTRLIDPPPTNPFATRWIRPGVIPFRFPPGLDAARLVERLAEIGWRGAIIGPHGSGKTTLLESLLPALQRAGRRVVRTCLHDDQRRLPSALVDSLPWRRDTVVVVDGYEQLNWWNRRRLDRLCVRSGCGLLVTSHGTTRLAELLRTEVSLELAQRIVARLLADRDCPITSDDVRRALVVRSGNLRETLFDLYDLHELRWREAIRVTSGG
jgi:energy-coupling factor transporter ATP-binding protein EcfA2